MKYTKVEISRNCKYNIQKDGVWTTKEGLRIWIPELEDNHLINIWRMIKDVRIPLTVRDIKLLRCEAESVLQGDAALDSIAEHFDEYGNSNEEDEVIEGDIFINHPKYDYIKKEIEKRGLQ